VAVKFDGASAAAFVVIGPRDRIEPPLTFRTKVNVSPDWTVWVALGLAFRTVNKVFELSPV
jgi:hypothetical protein